MKNIIQLIILKSKNIYGVNFKIVLNYEDDINEITKKNTEKKGFCDYYSIWVICGPPFEVLPIQDDESKNNPHLIMQFIDVLIKGIWKRSFFLS